MAHDIKYIAKRLIELAYISDERPLDNVEQMEVINLLLEWADYFGIEVPGER